MLDFDQFLNENRERLYKAASENTPKNSKGRACIPKDDEWREEAEWDDTARIALT